MAIKYSNLRSCWCVHPTQHTNYIDVMDWCANLWGWHRITNERDGTWSNSHGEYYGFTSLYFGYEFPDRQLYFSFVNEEDAAFFALRWA